MTQASPATRIDAALARIETAASAHRRDSAALARRHAALKAEVAAAIAALDQVLAAGRDD